MLKVEQNGIYEKAKALCNKVFRMEIKASCCCRSTGTVKKSHWMSISERVVEK